MQKINELKVDLRDALEKAESEDGHQRRCKELEERVKSDKKEMQRLRSMLGEAESKLKERDDELRVQHEQSLQVPPPGLLFRL